MQVLIFTSFHEADVETDLKRYVHNYGDSMALSSTSYNSARSIYRMSLKSHPTVIQQSVTSKNESAWCLIISNNQNLNLSESIPILFRFFYKKIIEAP